MYVSIKFNLLEFQWVHKEALSISKVPLVEIYVQVRGKTASIL